MNSILYYLVALGKGVHVFDQIDGFKQLKLKKAITLDGETIRVVYEYK